ncbi:site-specific integrase [Hyphomicrobium sp. MC1]|uniref:tyrosine-type recombinase/integrase n=1 Tax=Hyphomicrobium sp. (strain MC1) TaxID=717785 RepID=UPI000213E1C4|nr:site-specific integrase [Hyphomicrobium sp. MC1]CCB65859.1 putative Integrase family protein [Hyphomicrobium sp. MC1]
MTSRALTDLDIKHLKPRPSQYEVFDPATRGLAIRVSPGGTKAFVFLYRIGRHPRRYTIGRYPIVSLKSARHWASEALKLVGAGKDPQARKLLERERYRSSLFPAIATAFIEKYAKPNTKAWNETKRILEREFCTRWKSMHLHDISRHHVAEALDELVVQNGPSAANHGFAALRRLFNWCVERGELGVSPCSGLKQPAQTYSRERVLTNDEVVRIWNAAHTIGYPFGSLIKLLLLTGQRRSEVSRLCWADIDLETGLWTQPSLSNKSKRIHLVPLTGHAVEVLREIPRLNAQLVFPARGRSNRAVSGFSKWKRRLDKQSGTEGWTIHDVRRTVNTGLAALKVPPHIADLVLNHQGSVRSSVSVIYDRYDYLDEKRDALERWATHIDRLVAP